MKSIQEIKKELEKLKYAVFTNDTKDFNLNIIGVRSKNQRVNKFDDWLCVFWYYQSRLNQRWYQITTDPGISGMKQPLNSKGVAILAEGQYRRVYQIDKHQGKYNALCQRGGIVKVYRDNDKNNELNLDPISIEEGWFGINIHRAKDEAFTTNINGWSHGCQVFANDDDFEEFMLLCNKAADIWGNSFTYTLLSEV